MNVTAGAVIAALFVSACSWSAQQYPWRARIGAEVGVDDLPQQQQPQPQLLILEEPPRVIRVKPLARPRTLRELTPLPRPNPYRD